MSNVVEFPASQPLMPERLAEMLRSDMRLLGMITAVTQDYVERDLARSSRDTSRGKGCPARADGGEGERGCPTG